MVKLFGEASARQYFRVTVEDGRNYILMKLPAGASSVAEEITKSDGAIQELPFINIQKYLASLKLPVPEILAYSAEEGLMLLEDLEDQTLEKALIAAKPGGFRPLYERALRLLAELQRLTRENPSGDCIAFRRQFDEDLLIWELNHFLEYGIEDRFKVKVTDSERKKFDEISRDICAKIVQMPQGFVHRDYQSRNIMIYDESLWMLDFQDALLGPVLYDLVALLRDSYIAFTQKDRELLLQAYAGVIDAGHPYAGKLQAIETDFDLITLQRKLKDTGRFQYIHTVKKNPNFLKHVPQSIQYVKEAFGRQPQYREMAQIIEKYVPEFRSSP